MFLVFQIILNTNFPFVNVSSFCTNVLLISSFFGQKGNEKFDAYAATKHSQVRCGIADTAINLNRTMQKALKAIQHVYLSLVQFV